MKVVILAGGYGTRLSEETDVKPKPMVEIGDKPILWHILKFYSSYGFNDFIICLGYKGQFIKNYFLNYLYNSNDLKIDIENKTTNILSNNCEPWKISLIDTGIDSMTGGRIKRIKKYIEKDSDFLLTYGDGLSDVNLVNLIKQHTLTKSIITLTAIQPEGRYGALTLNNSKVKKFGEKLDSKSSWVNGGYFVVNKKIFSYLKNDSTIFEKQPLESLAKIGKLSAYKHNGFWQSMDTLRDKKKLTKIWNSGKAPWKKW